MSSFKISLKMLVALVLFTACATEIIPEKLTDDQLASTLMHEAGLQKMIADHFNPQYVKQEFAKKDLTTKEKRLAETAKIVSEVIYTYYSNTKSKMHEYILSSFSREEQIAMLKWHRSDMGRRIQQNFNSNSAEIEQSRMKRLLNWRAEYDKGQVMIDDDRMKLCKKISHLDGYIDYNIDFRKSANDGFKDGTGSERAVTNRRYQNFEDNKKFEREVELASYFLTKEVSVADLGKYVTYLEQPFVVRFNKTAWKPISFQVHDYWRTVGGLGRKGNRSPAGTDTQEFK